jgi:hypothetical protein
VIFAQLLINGAQNSKLAASFGYDSTAKRPELYIFPNNSNIPIKFPENFGFNEIALSRFISKYSPFFLG